MTDPLLATRFPCLGDLPAEQRTEAFVLASWQEPRAVRMRLADALADLPSIRGVYDLGKPTMAPELALKQGRSSTCWLTRHPDLRQARDKNVGVLLVECTGFQDAEGYLNMRWRIEIVEEPELRVGMAREAAARAAEKGALRRAEVAG